MLKWENNNKLGDEALIIKQFLIILGALFIGYEITTLTAVPIPANVMGLVLLFLALLAGLVKLKDVQATAEFILKYLALFFVVPTVGIMVYFDLLASEAMKIFIPLILSILIGLFTAGKVTEFFIRRSGDDYHE
jgi:holin-like protein